MFLTALFARKFARDYPEKIFHFAIEIREIEIKKYLFYQIKFYQSNS